VQQTASATLTDHLADRRLSAIERSRQINCDHSVPIFERAFKDASKLNDPSIVHQNVDAIEVFNGSGNERADIFPPTHISAKRFGIAAGCAYLASSVFGTRKVFVCDENCRALLSKPIRNSFADSARSSGYNRYLSLQSARHRLDSTWQCLVSLQQGVRHIPSACCVSVDMERLESREFGAFQI
jgi:hypothetical protein